MAKSTDLSLFVAMVCLNGVEYRNSDFKDSSAMICLHCVKIWWTSVQ